METKMVTIKQIRSTIRCTKEQIATIRGLGLKKINSTSTLKLTDSVAGMIRKVEHLVVVDSVA